MNQFYGEVVIMLNNIKIGTKLTVGFCFVLLLLLVVAISGYIGLVQSGKTTDDALATEDIQTQMQRLRRNIVEAQLISANGSLFRDLEREKERIKVDEEIAGIVKEVKDKLLENNRADFDKLVAVYDEFKKDDAQWYQVERDRVAGQAHLVENSTAAYTLLNEVRTMNDQLMRDPKESRKIEDELWLSEQRVVRTMEIDDFIKSLQTLRMDYYRAMSNANLEAKDKMFEDLVQETGDMIKSIKVYHAGTADPGRAEIIGKAVKAVEEWEKILKNNIDLMRRQAQIDREHDRDGAAASDLLVAIMGRLSERTAEIRKISSTTDATMKIVIAVVSAFALLLGFAISFIMSRDITGGLKNVLECVLKIVQDGDLAVEIAPALLRRGDEIGDLAKGGNAIMEDYKGIDVMASSLGSGDWRVTVKEKSSVDTMNQNLGKMLDQVNEALNEINESVKQVNTGAGEVSSAAQTLSSGAQESAASLEEITASMSEISSQTKANAQNASEARNLAQKATHAATDGQTAMQEMMEAMNKITNNAGEIQRVIKVIDDIAFQTNLLALNAAVEAARAGVHGKGFAVVAEEVRNLAARSSKAAAETNELISTSGTEIQRGGEVAAHTAEELNSIVEQIRQTTDLIAGIAVASNEQAQGVAQITVGLQQIDAVTQQNTAAAEESASAANEMSSMATNLQKLVARFHLRH